MLIRFKPGVSVDLAHDRMLDGLAYLSRLIEATMRVTHITVTSWSDGVHKVGSLHGVGAAVDVRCKIYKPEQVETVVRAFKAWDVKREYDLIWESKGQPNEHLHLEYDPKHTNG